MAGRGSRTRLGTIAVLTLFLLGLPLQAQAVPPPNDSFASRQVIGSVPYNDMVTTVDATEEPGEPEPDCAPIGKTVWYSYTPPTETVLAADTMGSDFDTVVVVYTGTGLGDLNPVTCSDDAIGLQARATFSAAASTTYHIQVGGYANAAGSLAFELRTVAAGIVSGTVTDQPTGARLPDICVTVFDADLDQVFFALTDDGGSYRVAVREGRYFVLFEDFCDDSNDHRSQWYRAAATAAEADRINVPAPGTVSGVDAALAPSCEGFGGNLEPQFIGSPGRDTFIGGPGEEIFCTFDGADTIRAEGGRDIVLAGRGADQVSAGSGSDRVFGEGGDDRLSGGSGRDRVIGDSGKDRISGGADNDLLFGQGGSDALQGGGGRDRCDGGKGRDRAGRSCERTEDVP